MYRLSLHQANR